MTRDVQHVTRNTRPQILCLRGNRLSDAGIKSLVDGICSNSACVLALHALPITLSHVTRHTSHVTHHTSHAALHTSHFPDAF